MSLSHRLRRAGLMALASRGRFWRLRDLHPPLPFWVNGKKFEILAPDTEGTRFTYSEIIAEDGYRIKKFPTDSFKVVVDIGANIGLFTCYAAARFPSAHIFAYEPNAQASAFLEKNIAPFTNITAEEKAVSVKLSEASLVHSDESTTGMIIPKTANAPTVQCLHPREIAPGLRIDLLKLDCEGSEFDILSDTHLLKRTINCTMEFHVNTNQTIEDLKHLIRQGGHTIIGSLPSNIAGCSTGYLYTRLTSA